MDTSTFVVEESPLVHGRHPEDDLITTRRRPRRVTYGDTADPGHRSTAHAPSSRTPRRRPARNANPVASIRNLRSAAAPPEWLRVPAPLRPITNWMWWQFHVDPTGYVRPGSILIGSVTAAMTFFLLCATVLSSLMLSDPAKASDNPQGDGPTEQVSTDDDPGSTSGDQDDEDDNDDEDRGSSGVVADVPPTMLALYRDAARTCPMQWELLAAVGYIESHHGQSNAAGVHGGSNYAGAQGPMQFLAGTWSSYGVDANHDGVADVYNPDDAVHGAAKYLCANGAGDPDRVRDALWNYNHSDSYVSTVLDVAADYRAAAYVLPISDRAAASTDLGRPHHDYPAIDIPVPVGTSTFAIHHGTVTTIDDGTCGKGVRLDIGNDMRATYCHLSDRSVDDGDEVEAGDPIGKSGGQPGAEGAGDSTGPHLHLQLEAGGTKVCPQPLLASWAAADFADPADATSSGCSS